MQRIIVTLFLLLASTFCSASSESHSSQKLFYDTPDGPEGGDSDGGCPIC